MGDFAEVQTGPFGSQLHASDYVDVGVPSLMPTNIGDRLNIKSADLVYVAKDDITRLIKYTVKEGDIVYSRRGDVEKCAYITAAQSGWLCGTGCLRIRVVKKDLDSKFCAFYLSTPEIKGWVTSNAVGTTMPNLNTSILGNLPLLLPPLPEQRAIATILSSLDDKIDLLHRQNATLEAMAEAVFRQWFVVEAREEWGAYTVEDIAEHIKINVAPSKKSESLFNHYSLPAFDANQEPTLELGRDILSNKFKVIPNAILVSKLNPRFPRIWYIGDYIRENSICSTEFQVLRPRDKRIVPFLYFFFRSEDAKSALTMAASGTSGSHQRVRPEDILRLEFSLPDFDRAILFSNNTNSLLEKMQSNQTQIRTLTALRDTLLPKLMSGEVRVKM